MWNNTNFPGFLYMHTLLYLVSYTSYIDNPPNKFTILQFSNLKGELRFFSNFIAVMLSSLQITAGHRTNVR